MGLLFSITEGWTGPLGPFTLKVNGVALDLTAKSVKLWIRPVKSNTFSDTTGEVVPLAPLTNGQVQFNPDVADFQASKSPYAAHFEVTDSGGKVVYFPNGDPDTIKVAKK